MATKISDQVTLTIDGVEVTAEKGTNVLQAGMDAGLYIPYLCYYPGMKSFGACRMCVVNIEGGRGSPASCTTPVADGMVVNTDTPEIVDLRKGIMDLLISEHPHGCLNCHRIDLCGPTDICLRHVSVNDRCVTCPKNERCELKDTVRYLELELDTPLTYNNRHLPQSVKDPMWEMDLNLCIVCGRCVRVCDEIRGDNALTFTDRAGRSLIGTSHGTSLLESGCEFCGACIDVCPTGSLVERSHKWDKAVKTGTSICPHCPVGCQMSVEVDKRNRLIRTIPDLEAPANRGQVCFKGKFGLEFVNHKKRLRNALVKNEGVLEESSVLNALDLVAEKLSEYKGDKFALIASPRGTNEDNYVAQKFARVVMGTNNVDLSSNLKPELVEPLGEMLGYQGSTNSIWDLKEAKSILVVSSNITEEHNVVAIPLKEAVRNGSPLVVVDSRETELTQLATNWLRPKPGTDPAVIGAILRVVVEESLDDHEFLDKRVENLDQWKNSLWEFDLVRVESLTGVSQEAIREAARLLASNPSLAILYALETIERNARDACVRSLVSLSLVTGSLGSASGGLFPLYSGTNGQGSRDVGCAPGHLPGYGPVTSDESRTLAQDMWKCAELPAETGLTVTQITSAIEKGQLKALLIIGDSPNFSNGEFNGFLDALKMLDFLVVQDTFASTLTDAADVVLPSTTFAEKLGTYTNMERRVQLLRPVLGAKGDEDEDWRILSQIARRMGAEGFGYEDSEAVFNEATQLVTLYGGISHERLMKQQGGIQWPCSALDSSGTSVLYQEDQNQKIKLQPLEIPQISDERDPDYPFFLVRGRVLHQSEREMEVAVVGKRNNVQRNEIFEVHKSDAANLGVSDGELVEVSWGERRLRGFVQLTSPHEGLIYTTSLFGQLIVDLDASKDPDPMLKVEGLPIARVRLDKIVDEVLAAD